jgi:SAM-dependent methyltransferase
MARVVPYYAPGSLSARYYDAVTAADPSLAGDEAIYTALVPPGGSVIELGCGTGRLTAALARLGLNVTGVDISPAMLAQARSLAEQLPEDARSRVELVQGDMTALDLKRIVDVVICPFFTLAHAPAGQAWRNTFATAARHLAPGGLAAFHLPRPDIMRRPGPDPARPVLELAVPEGRLRLFVRERRFREGVNRLDQVVVYAVADPAGRIVQSSAERLTYYWSEPEPPAAAAGLAPDRPPVDLGGVGDIWVFRKL